MARIPLVTAAEADADTTAAFAAVKAKLGVVPNLFATFARAPALMKAYFGFSEALAGGRLTTRQREVIALAVAQANNCQYCLSAHTVLGKGAGLSDAEVLGARAGAGGDAFEAALAVLAIKISNQRGAISDADLATARAAGIDDGLALEVVGNVILNLLTNYTNHVAGTDIDFPAVSTTL